MPRPEFPSPPCPLTSGMISRLRSDQAYYDQDPERAEREQQAYLERQEEEKRWEREYYDQQQDNDLPF